MLSRTADIGQDRSSSEESKTVKRNAVLIRAPLEVAYLVIVLLAAGWAFYTDVTLLHSQREHLLPDVLLLVVTFPSSLSLGYVYDSWPEWISGPLSQVVWLSLCGLGQVCFLFALRRVLQKPWDECFSNDGIGPTPACRDSP